METRLPLDEWVLPRVPYRSRAGSVVVAAGMLALGIVSPLVGLAPPPDPSLLAGVPWAPYAVAVLCAAAVLLRRRLPVAAVVVAAGLLLGQSAFVSGTLDVVTIITLADTLYAAMLVASVGARRAVLGIGAATCLGLVLVARPDGPGALLQLVLTFAALVGLPIAWGYSIRQRDALLAIERARADAVARASVAEREQAVRAERVAMAGELHDEIAARLSAISLQAGALAARGGQDARQREAVAAMRSASAEALGELRSLILVLSDGEAEAPVAVGIDDVAALEQYAATFGADLEAHVDVDAGMSAATSHALVRIAREGIANAARHEPGERIALAVQRDGDEVLLELRNRTTPAPSSSDRAASSSGTGLGLALMAERWRAVGGTGSAGPVGGDWVVRVRVPTKVAP